jgi:hypothetical protein
MALFEVLSPIKFDGEIRKIGAFIECELHEIEEMIGLGHAKATDPAVVAAAEKAAEDARQAQAAAAAAAAEQAEKEAAAARQSAIVEAIGKLDPENEDLWLRDGKPDTNAIADITGFPVSAADRNAAWATVQAAAQSGHQQQ